MMKARRVSILVVAFWLMASCAFAISLADVSVPSGIKLTNTHQHITASPNCIVYGFTVRAVANGGYAQLISSVSEPNITETSASAIGAHIVVDAVNAGVNIVLADIMEATANNTTVASWPKGIACSGKLFLDCRGADAEVYYKE